jgi:hypothetical protein
MLKQSIFIVGGLGAYSCPQLGRGGWPPHDKKKSITPQRSDVINIGFHLTTVCRPLSRFHTVHSYLNYNGDNSSTGYNGNNGEETEACTNYLKVPLVPRVPRVPRVPACPESQTPLCRGGVTQVQERLTSCMDRKTSIIALHPNLPWHLSLSIAQLSDYAHTAHYPRRN